MTRELDSLLDEVRMNMEYDVYSRIHDEIMLMETDFEETLLLKQRNIELENRTCESCRYCIKDVICEGSRECEEGISFIQSEAFCLVEGTDGCNRWKQK